MGNNKQTNKQIKTKTKTEGERTKGGREGQTTKEEERKEEFLRTFGVKSLGDLPILDQDQIEDFKKQAEEEAELKVEI